MDRVPPHSKEAEQAVLGSCLIDPEAVREAADYITPASFYLDRHGLIFRWMLELAERGEPVDLLTVNEELAANGELEEAGGASYLAELARLVPTAAHVAHYAQEVRELALRRDMIRAANVLASQAFDRSTPVEELLDRAEKAVMSLAQGGRRQEATHILHVAADRWEHLYNTRDDPGAGGLKTGFVDLDKVLGGLQPGNLVVLGARPSMGKTSWAFQLCLQVAEAGHGALLFSLEMSREELADRLAAVKVGVDSLKLRTRAVTESEWDSLFKFQGRLTWPLYIDDQPGLTTLEIRSRCRALARKVKLGLVAIDYLGLLGDRAENGQSRNDVVGAMTRRLKGLARELGCPVLVLSQLSRNPEHRADKKPTLADLRDSGNIEQDADVVIFLHRPEYYNPAEKPGICEVIIAKQRNGPVGTVELQFEKSLARFGNLARWKGGSRYGGAIQASAGS